MVWLCMDAPGVVEALTGGAVPPPEGMESEVLSAVTFEGATQPRAEVLAFVQSHGQSMVWRTENGSERRH